MPKKLLGHFSLCCLSISIVFNPPRLSIISEESFDRNLFLKGIPNFEKVEWVLRRHLTLVSMCVRFCGFWEYNYGCSNLVQGDSYLEWALSISWLYSQVQQNKSIVFKWYYNIACELWVIQIQSSWLGMWMIWKVHGMRVAPLNCYSQFDTSILVVCSKVWI